jgi:hypothetical protein
MLGNFFSRFPDTKNGLVTISAMQISNPHFFQHWNELNTVFASICHFCFVENLQEL